MKAPHFWWRPRPSLAACLLWPLGAGTGALTAARMARPGFRASVPVLCVGNLVAGGAGKTPTALALARMLQEAGLRPAFLSRGYGRTAPADARTVLRVDPAVHDFSAVGDEPLLLAGVAPTFVCADRRAAAGAAVAAGADVLVMDDGLQNPALAKDWTLAVIDGETGLGNGFSLPAGPLRAPARHQWPFVSAVCVIGEGAAGRAAEAQAGAAGRPVHRARLVPDPAAVRALAGRRLLAFAGIGRPEKFVTTLRIAGLDVVQTRVFPDHHRFSAGEIDALTRAAEAADAWLVTTTKDKVRLPADVPAHAVPVTLAFEQPEAIVAAALAAVRRTVQPS